VSKKAEIDAMLTRLQALSDDHFNYNPDDITWAHVGTLELLPSDWLLGLTEGFDAASRTPDAARRTGMSGQWFSSWFLFESARSTGRLRQPFEMKASFVSRLNLGHPNYFFKPEPRPQISKSLIGKAIPSC
jgi:hypothetical protein